MSLPFLGQRILFFSYFGSAGEVREETYAFESVDGINLTPINGGQAVLSELPDGEAYCLSVLRHHEGYVGVYGIGPRASQGGGSQIGIARSSDLLNWNDRNAISLEVEGRPKIWSPFPFLDDDGSFYIFYTAVSEGAVEQSLYRTRATDMSLTSFSEPVPVVITGNFGSLVQRDPFVMKAGNKYHLLFGGHSGIKHVSAYKVTGPWLVERGGTSGEAPWLTPIPNGWRLYFDYSERGPGNRCCDLSYDLRSGWTPYNDATPLTPANYHHACVVLVGESALETQNRFGSLAKPLPNRREFVAVDDFLGGTTATGIGALRWLFGGTGTFSGVAPTYADPRPGVARLRTTTNATAFAYADTAGAYAYNLGGDFELEITAKVSSLSNVRYALGISRGGTDIATLGGLYILIDPACPNFQVVAKGNSTRTIDTGVPLDTSWHTFRIRQVNSYIAASVANGAGEFSDEVGTTEAASYSDNAGSLYAIVSSSEAATKDLLLDRFALTQNLER